MALALDTNCLVRWLLWDNIDQAEVIAQILETSKSSLHVADMAMAEVVWVLKRVYDFEDDLVEGFVRKIIEHDKINCNRTLFTRVLDDMNASPKVSFVDSCLAHYAELNDTKLLTFDNTLAKRFPRLVKLATA